MLNLVFYKILVFNLVVKYVSSDYDTAINITDAPFSVYMPSVGCTGALIHPQWVLTAAHCFENKQRDTFLVGLGSHFTDNIKYLIQGAKVISHPQFVENSDSLVNAQYDMALVKLATPAKLSNTVNILKIEEANWPNLIYRTCTVTGFGHNPKEVSIRLHLSALNASRGCDCILYKKIICGSPFEGVDVPCFGDSGSIMICDGRGVAVTSRTIPSGYCSLPSGFHFKSYCSPRDTYLFSYITPHKNWYKNILISNSAYRKANVYPLMNKPCYHLIASLQMFVLIIIFYSYFCIQ